MKITNQQVWMHPATNAAQTAIRIMENEGWIEKPAEQESAEIHQSEVGS